MMRGANDAVVTSSSATTAAFLSALTSDHLRLDDLHQDEDDDNERFSSALVAQLSIHEFSRA